MLISRSKEKQRGSCLFCERNKARTWGFVATGHALDKKEEVRLALDQSNRYISALFDLSSSP